MAPHYCLLQVLLLALAALRAGACDITEMGPQTEAMNEKCCADGACNGAGVPSTCSASCAPVFETFWKDCGAYLNYLPGAEAMSDFALKCENKKPDDAGSKTTSCDSGTLLSTLFFACSGIDQNNAGSFCGTACSEGVEEFLKRCEEATDANKGVIKQAEQWMQQCNADASGSKAMRCHASDCRTGAQSNEPHCAKATTRGVCAGLSSADNNVFCRWQHCQTHGGAPSPPAPVVPGCTDSKAMNYNPKATVTANGACLYPEPPPPSPFVPPPPPSIPCTAAHYYGCKHKVECESVKMQWLPCSVLEKYGTNCGQGSDDHGTCTLPCTNASPHNCHTQDTCLAAGVCQALGAAPHQVGCQNLTTAWYSPAPRHDQGPVFPKCIRAGSPCGTTERATN